MPYEVVTIVVRKNYITLQLRYDTIRNLFFDSYRTLATYYYVADTYQTIDQNVFSLLYNLSCSHHLYHHKNPLVSRGV